jgi:hypothetical protein
MIVCQNLSKKQCQAMLWLNFQNVHEII